MRLIVASIIAVAVLAGAARAEDLPDRQPVLRIEPGMHTASVKHIGVDAACTMMVTGSFDKTARLWALPKGGRGSLELLRTLRVPIGEGNDGKVYAVALSPDGKWAAAGGFDAKAQERQDVGVYIFEAATGRLVTRLGRIGDVILQLAFSPDGSRLAATLGGGGGMRLWETAGWRPAAEDKDYGRNDSNGTAFDAANRLYTVADDGQIRRYGANGRLEAKAPALGGKSPFSVAVHPQSAKFAIGYEGTKPVEIYDAHTLKRLYAADMGGLSSDGLRGVAWSAGGTRLYAGGWVEAPTGQNPILVWQDEGRGRRSEAPLAQNTIMQLLPCGDGIAAVATDPAFGLIGADGAKRVWQEGVTADMRDKLGEAFTLSADGRRVRFGLQQGGVRPVLFDLATFELRDAPQPVPGLAAAKTGGVAVSDWKNSLAPKLDGRPIALAPYEPSRSLAIAPDSQRFVLGTEWWLRAYRAQGGGQWKMPVPGVSWGVNISGDGKLLVAAYAGGTIRWHRLSDGQELLVLFVHAKDRRFIAWTPKGYYAASPGGEDLIGWHVNRDWDHAADFYPASHFREQFNRPDIVKRVLGDLDEDKAIAEANRLAGVKPAEEIAKRLPPVIAILSPSEGSSFGPGPLTLRYSLRSPSGLAISEVNVLADGQPLAGAWQRESIPVSASDETERSLTLTGLPQHEFTLSLAARAGNLESVPASMRLKFRGGAQPPAR